MSEPTACPPALVVEREMPHPPEKIWRALTEGPLIGEWLLKNDFQPVVGHQFSFRAPPMPQWSGVVYCQVLVVDPLAKLSYTWDVGEEEEKRMKWVVTWTLTPTSGGVLVRMEQSGFKPQDEQAYQGATYGWRKFFGGLERVVAGLE
jgi:uncharacterized protein YndB with AHSA1/START domain